MVRIQASAPKGEGAYNGNLVSTFHEAPPQDREPQWMTELTDEQKAELQQLMDSLKASGASPDETRDAIDAKLQE